MNCCDEYGNCNQGRDCPIRKNRESQYPLKPVDGQVIPWLVAAVAVLLIVVAHIVLYLAA